MEFTTFSTASDSGPLATVRAMAEQLMAEHGLNDWALEFDRARQRAGECRRRKRVISLSEPLMLLWTPEQRRDTILHEIAHALTKGGHGAEWQAMCRKIGANPARTWGHNGEQEIKGQWLGTCPAGHTIRRQRITRTARWGSCGECSPNFSAANRYTWKKEDSE